MIVKCTKNGYDKIPQQYLSHGPDSGKGDTIASSVGKYYAVYAVREDSTSDAKWYFIYTDNGYLWWMPAWAYEITNDSRPEGWVDTTFRISTTSSYPSLDRWEIENGIIDWEKDATDVYFAEVNADSSFPTKEEIDKLNYEFEKQQRIKKYNEDLAKAKEFGWERPEKPEGVE